MTEQQIMLADMAGGLFAGLSHATNVADGWAQIEAMGFGGLLLDEAEGGFGGTWADVAIVARLAGYHALALPMVEAVAAAWLAAQVGFDSDGIGSLAERAEGEIADGCFTGVLRGVAWGRDAAFAAAPAPGGGAMLVPLGAARVEQRENIAGEPRDVLHLTGVPVRPVACDVFALGAALRTMQMAGALDAALATAVGYVNDRQQFGKPLGKLQAVQQALAVFACEAAATNCAANGVAQALDRGDAAFETAAAKARSNMAANSGAAIAHQVHGAIGFTQDYGLHPLTRRLWSWRSEFGSEQHWNRVLGQAVCASGADGYWASMVARTDSAD
ncbi:acyl-CoA dehydrogenase family protein [Blastomonas sp.]|uniref:acyl-CoA dehydrogenase family protein n=1 Tax=Blastomonas sp. TaxID=1909299 RepID=UPI00260C2FD1|nr:acyl-CoA dehydrogenase family protein [Blastomonas sp.]MDM7958104.1 acyl-CoA dehydrogenase family protein [Blastomonas sp.]